MEREHRGTLERVPRTPQNFSRIIWLSGIGTVARFRAFLIFLSRRLQGGWRAAPVPGGGVPSAVACPLGRSPILPFTYFPAPSPRPRSQSALPSGKGEIFNFLMQGASPLASPGLNRRGHRSRGANHAPSGGLSPAARGGWGVGGAQGGACLFGRLLTLPSVCFLSPIPPTPFPAGRGCPKVYFAGGFAPGTPALNRLRHLQILPYRCLAGSWLFCGTGFRRPGKAPRLGFRRAMPVPRPFSPRGCKGRSPLHKKTKKLPLPRRGRGAGGYPSPSGKGGRKAS